MNFRDSMKLWVLRRAWLFMLRLLMFLREGWDYTPRESKINGVSFRSILV